MSRLTTLLKFYQLLEQLGALGGGKSFAELKRAQTPSAGVYFFFEPGENRVESGTGLRVVRVGTHAITDTSRSTLWSRLKQHRGNDSVAGGNHRGSIFRLLIGDAIQRRDGAYIGTWGTGSSATSDVRTRERDLEASVSAYLQTMQVIVVAVPDRAERKALETGAIALLSNFHKEPLDRQSAQWLGQHSSRFKVRESGLWNNRDVDASYNEDTLIILERCLALRND